jgi:predicted ATPase
LVAAELLYQRGRPPRAKYIFKHVLIQDAAYASLLRSTRQRVHQQIAQLLETRFPEIVETQPELVAHHYTEAGLGDLAVASWQRAGQRAIARSANLEAISHLTTGLEVLMTLPDTQERVQHELAMLTTVAPALVLTKGYVAPEVEQAYARARQLCQRLGDTPQLFQVLRGLQVFYLVRGDLRTALELGEQLLSLTSRQHDPMLLVGTHLALGQTLWFMGDLTAARDHLDQGWALYNPQQHSLPDWSGAHPGMQCLCYRAEALWLLGYPNQAMEQSHEALALARELSHPYSLAIACLYAAISCQFRQDWQTSLEQVETGLILATEHSFPFVAAIGTPLQGWALAKQGDKENGIVQLRQGIATCSTMGTEVFLSFFRALLAEAYGDVGNVDTGLAVLDEAFVGLEKNGERFWESDLYRLKGELLLKQTIPDEHHAEACIHHALTLARNQQAKSLELRAATSLAKLWQSQDKRQDAYDLLAPVYEWFTEGFDTVDLKDAKAFLDELSAEIRPPTT